MTKKIIIDTSFKEVYNQIDDSFVIINPQDEKGLNRVRYEHGGVIVKDKPYNCLCKYNGVL